MPILSFTNNERCHLEDVLRAAPNPHTHPADAQIFAHRNLLSNSPEWLAETLHRMRVDAAAPGWLYIKNGPLGYVPDTPHDGDGRNSHHDFVGQAFLLGAMQELGLILTNRAEKRGNIPADITPVASLGRTKSSAGFSEPLLMHTENVHLPPERRPNYVGLYTLRGDPAGVAETLVAEARDMVAALNPETIEALRAPEFRIVMSESFKSGPSESSPMPVLAGPEDLPSITTEFNSTRCLTTRARDAFEQLTKAAERVSTHIRLDAGDLLITCNRRTIHGRGRFSPDFSHGQRRWLLRICTVVDLFELRDCVAPGANRAFDISATNLRDMIVHSAKLSGLSAIGPTSIPMGTLRTTLRAYDAWINAVGVPPSLPDFPSVEMVLFVAREVAQGTVIREVEPDDRLRIAMTLAQHALLEANLRGPARELDMRMLAGSLVEDLAFSDLLRICLSDPPVDPAFAQ